MLAMLILRRMLEGLMRALNLLFLCRHENGMDHPNPGNSSRFARF